MENKKLYTILFILILIMAFGIRLYYFFPTLDQVSWWDSTEYLLKAKSIAFGTPTTGWAPERELVVPIIFSIFFSLGLGEIGIRVLQLLVSVGTVAMTYITISKVISRKVALYSTFGMAFFWLHIFFTQRILLYLWVPLLYLSIVYFFYRGFLENKKKHIIIFAILASIGFQTYFSVGFLLAGLFIYLFIIKGFKIFKDKRAWLVLFIFILVLLPYMIYSQITFGFPIPRMKVGVGAAVGEPGAGLSAITGYLKMMPSRVGWVFTILSFFGIILFIPKFFKRKSWLLIFICFFMPLFFYTLYAVVGGQGVIYDAFILPIFPFMFAFVGYAMNRYKNMNKNLLVVVIILILILHAYYGIVQSDLTIRNKIDSYSSVKTCALWIKENSNPEDIIITMSRPQNTYYSERISLRIPEKEEEFEILIQEKNPRYLVISIWEQHPEWVYSYPDKKDMLPVYADLMAGTNQPTSIVYQLYEN